MTHEPMTDRQLETIVKEISMSLSHAQLAPIATAMLGRAHADLGYLVDEYKRLRTANDELSRAYAQFHQEASDETRHLRDEIDRLRARESALQDAVYALPMPQEYATYSNCSRVAH